MDSDISDHNPVDMETEDADLDESKRSTNKEDVPEDVQDKNDSSLASEGEDRLPKSAKGRKPGQLRRSFGTAFPCQFCPNSYKIKGNLKSHLIKAHPEEYNRDACFHCDFPGCEMVCNTEIGVKLRKSMHKKEMTKMKKEVEDSDKDDEKSDGKDDKSQDKEKEKKYVDQVHRCLNCAKRFINHFFLNRHLENCKHKFIYCPKCEEVLQSVEELDDHLENSKCDAVFTDSDDSNLEENSVELSSLMIFSVFRGPKIRPNQLKKGMLRSNIHTALSLLVAENIEKNHFSLMWTAVFTHVKIHPNEVIVFWTDKIDESYLNATANGHHNVVLCIKKIDILEFLGKYKNAVQNAFLASFIILESADTFSEWTTIIFNDCVDPSVINQKVFGKIENAEEKLSEGAEKNGKIMINMMEFGDNDFFRTHVKKLSKKILVFNCPE